jgi:glycerophosphoryl diester phosphodiesterase
MSLDPTFLVIGHRGAAGLEPENTLRSFARAIELGVDAIELDAYLVDDRIVVIHDDTLERTTNGKGRLSAHSLEQLRTLDAGKGERIPLLEEVLDLVAHRVAVNVELKGRGTARPVARIAAQYPGTQVLVSSFDHRELATFRATTRSTPVAPLFDRDHPRLFEIAADLEAWSINVSRRMVTPALIASARAHGLNTLVYTVNDASEAARLEQAGAKGLFTDFPDRIRATSVR